MIDVVLGIDIGGTNTKLGFITESGECLKSSSIRTYADEPINVFMSHLKVAVEEMEKSLGKSIKVKGIGMGAPNGNYYNGHIEKAPNLNWGDNVPMAAMLQREMGMPVWLTNDANAAAIGEMAFGVAKGMKNFLVITLGTGLGSGIVMNGRLIYGHDGFAGEVGHCTVEPGGRDHSTNRKGSLETYASATGVTRTVTELLANRVHPSELRDISFKDLTSKRVAEEAAKGDPIALEAFEATGELLGIALSDTVVLCDPEAIIIFGGVAAAGDLLMNPIKKHLENNLPIYLKGKVKVLLSNLKGANTAVLGAGALAWEEISRVEVVNH